MGLFGFKRKNNLRFKKRSKSTHNVTLEVKTSHRKDSPGNGNKERRGSMKTQSTAYTSALAKPDVPINFNISKRDGHGGVIEVSQKGLSQQFSTFSLLSAPSFSRGISEHLENPYVWEYDRDVYTRYDVNDELKEDDELLLDGSGTKVHKDNAEDPLFASNPLPEIKTHANSSRPTKTRRDHSFSTLESSVTDIPVGDPAFATPDITRDLVKKFISEIWNCGDLTLIPIVCSPKIRFNGPEDSMARLGHEGFANMVKEIHDAFGEYHCEIHSIIVEGNKAFCRLRFSGKHIRRLMGYPATGRLISWMGATEFTCVDGKILKVWELADVQTLVEQLSANIVTTTPKEDRCLSVDC